MSVVMGWDEWAGYDAVGLAQLVRQGRVTPQSWRHRRLPVWPRSTRR